MGNVLHEEKLNKHVGVEKTAQAEQIYSDVMMTIKLIK